MFRTMQRKAEMVEKVLRRPAVQEATSLSRSTIYDLMSKGKFPRPIKLTGKAVAWREGDITAWLNSRVETDA